ncbi:conserved Plasmodium protein, unknown function [Plasmodium knowlesi strain H]|uniref:3'-5' exonuclease domain-containing protein n=3 Tax=Plasmodium knowlesi TaxID=5850 RepID=A0A5K1V5F0_PLAKH|nr:conserved Plasmodium protein, unknown function [Plasmodium knowlesi strain H]OTN66164.1 Uncharacterized protein PKNOH_S09522300 [Plasmodium knowlesi]CAA9986391.1 conserved Plasmodium protein, unknown function [Plasmodium knowlesi strain H]SBO25660.1 conserved Plasmodium protein, unknown function [Plasmodium knowlesi strain H]SBO28376.1 conserved Plasmodium protein, unknown function [Plasmodium knowlesi strain H]VVS75865.1 conserved Plasmodium protein, unknown function [Plasmodium knowlesi s|eukprot:XP_002257797.1 hypothetical protein, conserved in Plasmodium species [Plasmodium knowlesi strain H]
MKEVSLENELELIYEYTLSVELLIKKLTYYIKRKYTQKKIIERRDLLNKFVLKYLNKNVPSKLSHHMRYTKNNKFYEQIFLCAFYHVIVKLVQRDPLFALQKGERRDGHEGSNGSDDYRLSGGQSKCTKKSNVYITMNEGIGRKEEMSSKALEYITRENLPYHKLSGGLLILHSTYEQICDVIYAFSVICYVYEFHSFFRIKNVKIAKSDKCTFGFFSWIYDIKLFVLRNLKLKEVHTGGSNGRCNRSGQSNRSDENHSAQGESPDVAPNNAQTCDNGHENDFDGGSCRNEKFMPTKTAAGKKFVKMCVDQNGPQENPAQLSSTTVEIENVIVDEEFFNFMLNRGKHIERIFLVHPDDVQNYCGDIKGEGVSVDHLGRGTNTGGKCNKNDARINYPNGTPHRDRNVMLDDMNNRVGASFGALHGGYTDVGKYVQSRNDTKLMLGYPDRCVWKIKNYKEVKGHFEELYSRMKNVKTSKLYIPLCLYVNYAFDFYHLSTKRKSWKIINFSLCFDEGSYDCTKVNKNCNANHVNSFFSNWSRQPEEHVNKRSCISFYIGGLVEFINKNNSLKKGHIICALKKFIDCELLGGNNSPSLEENEEEEKKNKSDAAECDQYYKIFYTPSGVLGHEGDFGRREPDSKNNTHSVFVDEHTDYNHVNAEMEQIQPYAGESNCRRNGTTMDGQKKKGQRGRKKNAQMDPFERGRNPNSVIIGINEFVTEHLYMFISYICLNVTKVAIFLIERYKMTIPNRYLDLSSYLFICQANKLNSNILPFINKYNIYRYLFRNDISKRDLKENYFIYKKIKCSEMGRKHNDLYMKFLEDIETEHYVNGFGESKRGGSGLSYGNANGNRLRNNSSVRVHLGEGHNTGKRLEGDVDTGYTYDSGNGGRNAGITSSSNSGTNGGSHEGSQSGSNSGSYSGRNRSRNNKLYSTVNGYRNSPNEHINYPLSSKQENMEHGRKNVLVDLENHSRQSSKGKSCPISNVSFTQGHPSGISVPVERSQGMGMGILKSRHYDMNNRNVEITSDVATTLLLPSDGGSGRGAAGQIGEFRYGDMVCLNGGTNSEYALHAGLTRQGDQAEEGRIEEVNHSPNFNHIRNIKYYMNPTYNNCEGEQYYCATPRNNICKREDTNNRVKMCYSEGCKQETWSQRGEQSNWKDKNGDPFANDVYNVAERWQHGNGMGEKERMINGSPIGAPPIGVPPIGVPPIGVPPIGAPPIGVPPIGVPLVIGSSSSSPVNPAHVRNINFLNREAYPVKLNVPYSLNLSDILKSDVRISHLVECCKGNRTLELELIKQQLKNGNVKYAIKLLKMFNYELLQFPNLFYYLNYKSYNYLVNTFDRRYIIYYLYDNPKYLKMYFNALLKKKNLEACLLAVYFLYPLYISSEDVDFRMFYFLFFKPRKMKKTNYNSNIVHNEPYLRQYENEYRDRDRNGANNSASGFSNGDGNAFENGAEITATSAVGRDAPPVPGANPLCSQNYNNIYSFLKNECVIINDLHFCFKNEEVMPFDSVTRKVYKLTDLCKYFDVFEKLKKINTEIIRNSFDYLIRRNGKCSCPKNFICIKDLGSSLKVVKVLETFEDFLQLYEHIKKKERVIFIDAEWKCTIFRENAIVSIFQVALKDTPVLYIIDLKKIAVENYEINYYISDLFRDQNIIKVGVAFLNNDMLHFRKYYDICVMLKWESYHSILVDSTDKGEERTDLWAPGELPLGKEQMTSNSTSDWDVLLRRAMKSVYENDDHSGSANDCGIHLNEGEEVQYINRSGSHCVDNRRKEQRGKENFNLSNDISYKNIFPVNYFVKYKNNEALIDKHLNSKCSGCGKVGIYSCIHKYYDLEYIYLKYYEQLKGYFPHLRKNMSYSVKIFGKALCPEKEVNKECQIMNWNFRPLSSISVEYAILDVLILKNFFNLIQSKLSFSIEQAL